MKLAQRFLMFGLAIALAACSVPNTQVDFSNQATMYAPSQTRVVENYDQEKFDVLVRAIKAVCVDNIDSYEAQIERIKSFEEQTETLAGIDTVHVYTREGPWYDSTAKFDLYSLRRTDPDKANSRVFAFFFVFHVDGNCAVVFPTGEYPVDAIYKEFGIKLFNVSRPIANVGYMGDPRIAVVHSEKIENGESGDLMLFMNAEAYQAHRAVNGGPDLNSGG